MSISRAGMGVTVPGAVRGVARRRSAPAVVVHGMDDVRRALAPRTPLTLLSGEGAGGYAGVEWWRALAAFARAEAGELVEADILDCGALPGRALEALAGGQRLVRLDASVAAFADLAERAGRCGARLLAERPAALDLGTPGATRRLIAWLAGDG